MEKCKEFLGKNVSNLSITDFSLDSIGIILFRYEKKDIFKQFIDDIIPNLNILSLPIESYGKLITASTSFSFDFDDAYQYNVAKYY